MIQVEPIYSGVNVVCAAAPPRWPGCIVLNKSKFIRSQTFTAGYFTQGPTQTAFLRK